MPFRGTEGEIIDGHKFKEPPRIKNKISRKLKRLIYGLLIKNPEKRWKEREIKKYIEEKALPFLPKEKKKMVSVFYMIFIIILSFLIYQKFNVKEITSAKIENNNITAVKIQ